MEGTSKGDYRGLPQDPQVFPKERVFDYDRKKLMLTLEKEKDVTQERISHKETLKSIEVNSLQAFYPENKVMINGFEICEKPEISMTKPYTLDASIWGF